MRHFSFKTTPPDHRFDRTGFIPIADYGQMDILGGKRQGIESEWQRFTR
jgi:hypothetical protein